MFKYAVFDNGRPAKYPDCKVNKNWKINIFDTFDQAIQYLDKWLGSCSMGEQKLRDESVDYFDPKIWNPDGPEHADKYQTLTYLFYPYLEYGDYVAILPIWLDEKGDE